MKKSLNKKKEKLCILITIIAVIVVCCISAYLNFFKKSDKTYKVPLIVNAQGLDTEKGTKIPLHITGKDINGEDVNEVIFYKGDNFSNIVLKPGNYTIFIDASPISENGIIYDIKDAITKVNITGDGNINIEKEITIDPIAAEKMNDEEIESAYNVLKYSGIEFSILDKLKNKAQKYKDDALVAKKEKEEREKKKAAEVNASNNKHFLVTDYFYVDILPQYWNPRDWSVEKKDKYTWLISHKPVNDYGGGLIIRITKKIIADKYIELIGATGTGYNVYVSGAGAGIRDYVNIVLTKKWSPYDPDSIRADGFTNREYNEISQARQRLKEENNKVKKDNKDKN